VRDLVHRTKEDAPSGPVEAWDSRRRRESAALIAKMEKGRLVCRHRSILALVAEIVSVNLPKMRAPLGSSDPAMLR